MSLWHIFLVVLVIGAGLAFGPALVAIVFYALIFIGGLLWFWIVAVKKYLFSGEARR